MSRIFVTGDTHGDFFHIFQFCKENNTSKEDIMIICGDAGINYYLGKRDRKLKTQIAAMPITFLIVHGNHEERAWNVDGYVYGAIGVGDNLLHCWFEPAYPNICFVNDFKLQEINGKRFMFIGGAYSVDKWYRIGMGYNWFESEQITLEDMDKIIDLIYDNPNLQKVNYIVTHTCPLKYEPTEVFLPGIDQSTVDKRTESFLDKIEELVNYDSWIAGHFHTNKTVDKMRFLFDDIIELG